MANAYPKPRPPSPPGDIRTGGGGIISGGGISLEWRIPRPPANDNSGGARVPPRRTGPAVRLPSPGNMAAGLAGAFGALNINAREASLPQIADKLNWISDAVNGGIQLGGYQAPAVGNPPAGSEVTGTCTTALPVTFYASGGWNSCSPLFRIDWAAGYDGFTGAAGTINGRAFGSYNISTIPGLGLCLRLIQLHQFVSPSIEDGYASWQEMFDGSPNLPARWLWVNGSPKAPPTYKEAGHFPKARPAVAFGPQTPSKRTKEVKTAYSSAAYAQLMNWLSSITESLDALNAFWKALPPGLRSKPWRDAGGRWHKPSPWQKFRDLWRNAYSLNLSQAALNLLQEQFEDRVWALGSDGIRKASRRSGRPVGYTAGPAL